MPEFKFDMENVAGIVIMVIILVAGSMYAWNQFMVPQTVVDGEGIPTEDIFAGNLDVKTKENDYIAGSTHSSTNDKVFIHALDPVSESTGVALTSSAVNFELSRASGGYAWISIHNGDDEFLITPWMEGVFKTHNPRVKEVYYKDLDSDDKMEMVGKCWFGDMVVGSGQDPEWTLIMNWIDEDIGLAISSPSDLTGQGTGSGTSFGLTWLLSGWTAGDGCPIVKLYVVTNDTREGEDITLQGLRMYGDITVIGKTSWSAPEYTSSSAYEGYYYMPTDYTDPFNGILTYRGTQASDELYVSLAGKTYHEANGNITVDLFVVVVGGDGTTAQLTDSVTLSA